MSPHTAGLSGVSETALPLIGQHYPEGLRKSLAKSIQEASGMLSPSTLSVARLAFSFSYVESLCSSAFLCFKVITSELPGYSRSSLNKLSGSATRNFHELEMLGVHGVSFYSFAKTDDYLGKQRSDPGPKSYEDAPFCVEVRVHHTRIQLEFPIGQYTWP